MQIQGGSAIHVNGPEPNKFEADQNIRMNVLKAWQTPPTRRANEGNSSTDSN